MTKSYPTKLVLELTNASENQLKYWVKVKLVKPLQNGKSNYYSFRDIITLRLVVSLKSQGLSLQKIRQGLQNLSKALPQSDECLTRLVIYTNGIDMIVCEKGRHFSAITKQRYLSIDTERIQARISTITPSYPEQIEVDKALAVLSS